VRVPKGPLWVPDGDNNCVDTTNDTMARTDIIANTVARNNVRVRHLVHVPGQNNPPSAFAETNPKILHNYLRI
jgi:hypothetical protein